MADKKKEDKLWPSLLLILIILFAVWLTFSIQQQQNQVIVQSPAQNFKTTPLSCDPYGEPVCASNHCCPIHADVDHGLCCTPDCLVVDDQGVCIQYRTLA